MLIEIRHLNFSIADALRKFVHRRVAWAIEPFQDGVARADVRLRDVNGPRGGVDTECSVTLDVAGRDQPVVVKGEGRDGYEAVQIAAVRLREAISRVLTKRRRLGRFGVSPEKSAALRAAPAPEAGATGGTDGSSGAAGDFDAEDHIVVTAADRERLRGLIQASRDTRDRDAARALAEELDHAEIVPAERIADDIVTMNSRVVFRDENTGDSREISLVYPENSAPEHGRISILAPLGTALLGLAVGQTIDWPLPGDRRKRYRVEAVLYQPEAAEDQGA